MPSVVTPACRGELAGQLLSGQVLANNVVPAAASPPGPRSPATPPEEASRPGSRSPGPACPGRHRTTRAARGRAAVTPLPYRRRPWLCRLRRGLGSGGEPVAPVPDEE